MRKRLFEYIANGEHTAYNFLKHVYHLSLDHESIKRKLYHKYDVRVLNNLNYIEFLQKINHFFTNYDPEAVSFNNYIYGKYD